MQLVLVDIYLYPWLNLTGELITRSKGEGFNIKPVIVHDLCIGDGICETICPEVFELRDDGLAYVIDENPSEDLRSSIEEAIEACPTEAIEMEE